MLFAEIGAMKLRRTTVWLDPKTVEALKKIGKKEDRSVAWLIRHALEKFVKERES
jgi:predicted transcriptional regulator